MSEPYCRVDPIDCDDTYDMLRGPDGFECALGEPEDRTWGRDGTEVVKRLNEQYAEIEQLTRWVHDLQSHMYINCVYCGHRYGPEDEVEATMQEALYEHIAKCQKHPLTKAKQEIERLQKQSACDTGLIQKMGDNIEWLTADSKQLLEEVANQHAAIESADAEIVRLTVEIEELKVENFKLWRQSQAKDQKIERLQKLVREKYALNMDSQLVEGLVMNMLPESMLANTIKGLKSERDGARVVARHLLKFLKVHSDVPDVCAEFSWLEEVSDVGS